VTTQEDTYDYVVIGAGSAGCIVAARLAEGQAGAVLLLEAGDAAELHPETLSADGFKYAFANDDLMWHRMTAPQGGCGGRGLYAGSGRGMGGSGSVNGMVYTRGDTRDYAGWPSGWRWDDIEPAFERVEQQIGIQPRAPTPFAQRFLDAAVAAGFSRKDGMNDGDLAGVVGCNDVNYSGDQRRSSYRAWLHGRQLPNLRTITGATVHRLVFDQNLTAIAVDCEVNGAKRRFGIGKEAVVCAGALETPKLLILSGVGPRAEVEAHRIPVVLDAPGVGQHLQDHPNVCLFYRSRQAVDFQYPQIYGFDAARRLARDARNQAPDTCFVCYAAPASLQQSMQRMLPILALPGWLYRIRPLRSLLRGLINFAFALPTLQRFVSTVFGIVVILGKPESRGEVGLSSADPRTPARVDPGYYKSPHDQETMLAAISKAGRIAAQAAFTEVGVKPLSVCGKSVAAGKIWKWVTSATMTTFHYCGSCRMGEDSDSPVDTKLRVKGLRNVRVADASVMPEIPVSALNAPSMMIGYRAADFILGEKNS
jgi:choline dehydrogenase